MMQLGAGVARQPPPRRRAAPAAPSLTLQQRRSSRSGAPFHAHLVPRSLGFDDCTYLAVRLGGLAHLPAPAPAVPYSFRIEGCCSRSQPAILHPPRPTSQSPGCCTPLAASVAGTALAGAGRKAPLSIAPSPLLHRFLCSFSGPDRGPLATGLLPRPASSCLVVFSHPFSLSEFFASWAAQAPAAGPPPRGLPLPPSLLLPTLVAPQPPRTPSKRVGAVTGLK